MSHLPISVALLTNENYQEMDKHRNCFGTILRKSRGERGRKSRPFRTDYKKTTITKTIDRVDHWRSEVEFNNEFCWNY